jgi:predicted permease
MRTLRAFFLRLGGLFHKQRRERDLAEEIESCLQLHIEDNLRAGMNPQEARRSALLKFGGIEAMKEAYRDRRSLPWLESLARDLRYGGRTLRRSPGFTAVAAITLALGIGANTAIFSVINAVLLRPLPYRDPQQLLRVWETAPRGRMNANRTSVSPVNFLSWSQEKDLFEDVTATTSGLNQTLTLTGVDSPAKLMCDRVTGSFFRLLGVEPVLGRTFAPEEEQPGHDQVVLLSHDLWQTLFGADPQILGRPLTLDNTSYRVIGALPPGFRSPDRVNSREGMFLVRPLTFDADQATDRGEHFLTVVARLKRGVTLAQAQAKLDSIARNLERQYPETNQGWGVRLVPLQDDLVQEVRRALLVLAGAIGLVLLISCVNVANLLLARAATQTKEMAIRAALGAGRSRLIRQLLTQSLLLALLGGTLGVVLAFWGTEALLVIAPTNIPRLQESTVDLTVLGFTLLASVLAGLIFGLVPAWQISRTDLQGSLKESGRTKAGSLSAGWLRRGLVITEVALALVLAIGAGLLIQTFRVIQSIEPGYRAENVLAMNIAPPPSKYRDRFERAAYFQQVIERVEALPGVLSAGVVTDFPLGGSGGGTFLIEGRTPPADFRQWDAEFRAVSPGYFRTMGIPLLRGRSLTPQDAEKALPVAVINRTMARRFWPGESPLGARLRRARPADAPWVTIVGIIGDVRHRGPTYEPFPEVYLSYLQPFAQPFSPALRFPFPRELVVRADSDPWALVPALQRSVWAVDKDQPISQVRTLEQLHSRSIAPQRFHMLLLSLFGAIGTILASVGIYGVLSYTITARLHEIGIRMALGAQRKQILSLVVGEGMVLATLGIGIGLAGAFGVTRVLSSLLFGVTPTDPATFVGVPALLLGVALAACCIPAWKATRVDPLIALRCE